MKILVCNPAFYDVTYSINPWMLPENGINSNLAITQWRDLVILLEHVGAEVIHMSGREKLPDIVFTANAGFMNYNRVLLSNFKYPERQPEKEVYKNWFEDHGYECQELPDGVFFEGAGDVLARNSGGVVQEIFFGHGFRSDETANEYLHLHYNVTKLKLVDSYFYHLDTCFCPLSNDFALIYPDAFEEGTVKRLMQQGMELLHVPSDEAHKFACNAVTVGNCVVIPSGCPQTKEILQRSGYEVYDTDMSEYIKAGGACKCLTFKLDSLN